MRSMLPAGDSVSPSVKRRVGLQDLQGPSTLRFQVLGFGPLQVLVSTASPQCLGREGVVLVHKTPENKQMGSYPSPRRAVEAQ